MNRFLLSLCVLIFSACTTPSKPSAPEGVEAVLKMSSGVGHLKAKLMLKNNSSKEILISDLNSKNFRVETMDGKPMAFKGAGTPAEALKIAPGQTDEAAFSLQDSFGFWDRRTRYKIWYETSGWKSNAVSFWF